MLTPVVLIVFNRPDFTRRVLERIRHAKPASLFIVADGPRESHPDDVARVAAVREIVESSIDWPCEVRRNYASGNLGCMDRVRTGLDWVFGIAERAIILEDDCLPDLGFFAFCHELLEKYRDEAQIMSIGGTNFIAPYYPTTYSYWFSHHPWTWGWATWRRAWLNNDFEMTCWESRQDTLRDSFGTTWERQYWISTFEQARRDLRAANCWDFQWNFTCRSLGGVSIVPQYNMVENLGFVEDATHKFGDMSRFALPTKSLFPVNHPPSTRVDPYADDLWTRIYSGVPLTPWHNLKSRMRVLRDRCSRGLLGSAA